MNLRNLDFNLRLSDIVFIAVFVTAVALGPRMLAIDSDLGRHLAVGNYMVDARIVPTIDLFSHTRAGFTRPPYEWLSQILFALAYRLLRLDGVILLTSLVIASTFSFAYRYASQKGGLPVLPLILVLIAAAASSIHWLPRPHIFTFLLLAIWIEQLDKISEGKPVKLLLTPILMLLWANMHGGFVFGVFAWVTYFAGWLWNVWRKITMYRSGKNLLIVGVTSLIATIITPDLWHNWEAVLNNRSVFIINRTVETMRPRLTDPSVLPYTLLLLLAGISFTLGRKTVKTQHIFLLGGLGVASLLMSRNIPLFAIACIPILSEVCAKRLSRIEIWKKVEERFTGFNPRYGRSVWPFTVCLLIIMTFAFLNIKNGDSVNQFNSLVFPVSAVNSIEANPPTGNMFNEFNWGGYLLYRFWPKNKVFLDSQSDFYGESLIREYDQIMSANSEWKNLLEKYQVNWLLIPVDSPLAGRVSDDPEWKIVRMDNVSVIAIRR